MILLVALNRAPCDAQRSANAAAGIHIEAFNVSRRSMHTLTIGALLSGALLGRWFKVLVLIPTIFVTTIAAFVGWMLGSDGFASVLWKLACTSIGLQLGYVAGVAIRLVVSDLGRALASVRRNES